MQRMIDRAVVEEFLDCEFEDSKLEITEDDYYKWVKDNFKSFFDHGDPDCDWVKGRIEQYSER